VYEERAVQRKGKQSKTRSKHSMQRAEVAIREKAGGEEEKG